MSYWQVLLLLLHWNFLILHTDWMTICPNFSSPSLSICNIMNLEKVRSFLRYNRHVLHENNRILMACELTGKSWNDSSNTWSIPFINRFSSPTYSLCIHSSLGYSVFNNEPKCEHEYLIFMYQNLPHCHSSKQLPSGRQNNWTR